MRRYSTIAFLTFVALLCPLLFVGRAIASPTLWPVYMAIVSFAILFMLPSLLTGVSVLLLLADLPRLAGLLMAPAILIVEFADRLAFHHSITAKAIVSCAILQAYAYRMNAKFDEGIKSAKGALIYLEQAQGRNWPDLAPILSDLGALYLEAGRLTRARAHLSRALSLADLGQRMDRSAAGLATLTRILGNLALTHMKLGDFPVAIIQYRRCVELNEQGYCDSRLPLAVLLCHMANAYLQNGEYDSALPVLLRAIRIAKDESQSGQLEVSIEGSLGEAFRGLGNLNEARRHLDRAFQLAGERLGKEDPCYASVLEDLGKLHRDLGDLSAAESYFKQILDLVKQAGLAETLEFSRCLKSYADCLRRMNRNREAADLEHRAEKIKYKVRSA